MGGSWRCAHVPRGDAPVAVHDNDNTAERPDEGTGVVRNEVATTSIHTVVQAGVVHGGVHVHARPDRVPPHQLPLAPAGFVGRVDQLAQLDKTLVSPTPSTDDGTSTAVTDPGGGTSATAVISALGGAGGIGKTWLALGPQPPRPVPRRPTVHRPARLRPYRPAERLRGRIARVFGVPSGSIVTASHPTWTLRPRCIGAWSQTRGC